MAPWKLCFALLLLAISLPCAARAQWSSDSTANTPICTLTSQQDDPQICSDESDGAIIVWQDTRNGGVTNIYAQRINAAGRPMWTQNGIRVCTPYSSNSTQRNPVIASDGNGGAYVVWQDSRNSSRNGIDLYGQHIGYNGLLIGADTGFKVSDDVRDQINPVICSDGHGGAFVVWEDYSSATLANQPDIGLNRLYNGSATLGPTGILAVSGLRAQRNPALCDDGSGGCYLAWENSATLPSSICANHFSAA